MTGDDRAEDYDEPRIPAALRERIEQLFVEYRGYEPATFQESLSLVADLAAARIEAEAAGAAEAVDALQDGQADAADASAPDAGHADTGDAGASGAGATADEAGALDDSAATADVDEPGADAHAEPVAGTSTEVVDDAGEERFAELEDDGATHPGADATTDAAAVREATAGDAGADDGEDEIPESLRADPESNCALCGEVHPVSVLETTIPEDADSIALVCPSCSD